MYIKSIYLHFSLSIWTTSNFQLSKTQVTIMFLKIIALWNGKALETPLWQNPILERWENPRCQRSANFADFNHGLSVMQIPKTNKWSPDLFPRLQDVRKTHDSCGPKLRNYDRTWNLNVNHDSCAIVNVGGFISLQNPLCFKGKSTTIRDMPYVQHTTNLDLPTRWSLKVIFNWIGYRAFY